MSIKKYGHFSKDGKEFIITNPTTPRPWINYLTNEEYCAIISQNAGGYSFYKDCRTHRILRWAPESWHFDRPGRYIYMRDKKTKKCWSASYQPLRVKPEHYETRHGLGYTTTNTTYNGVNTQMTFFVPTKDTCEVWLVKVANKTNSTKNLEIFPYVEWLLGDYHTELRYRNIMNLYNRVWYDKIHKAIFAKKTAFWGKLNIQPYAYINFFASSLNPAGYATQKDSFLGRNNTEENPEMVLSGKFNNTPFTSGEDSIACFKHNLTLKPGQEKEFTIVLGQAPSKGNSLSTLLTKYRTLSVVKKELETVKKLWHKRVVENIEVETPDKDFDTIVNIWVKYQLYICNFWSRSPSYYHEGAGGRGYRDSCQDADSIMSINYKHAREKIMKIASLIRQDGTSAPGWADTTGSAGHRPNKDHQIWLTATVASYIKETGDKDILKEYIPYLKDRWIKGWSIDSNDKGPSRSEGEGTLFEHLKKNLNFTFDDVGPHGLPLIGHADWNDAIDAAGIKLKGESVWLAQALVRSLKILAELSQLIGESKKADEFMQKAHTMSERINEICWDGDWYIRGFTDNGSVYGSRKNKEGKIYINSQSWAILSGVADEGKQKKILKSVDKYIDGKHGAALFYPAYSSWDEELGRISMFSEGTKENAAVFCHAATFHIVAECMAGRGTKAYEGIKKLMPNSQGNYDLYKTEPYVYAEYIVGPQHPYLYGEGAFTWITGAAGWQFMAATEWLLGARRDYDGLRIDPCIPKKWKKARIKRPFRGAIYDITIYNPNGKERGVKEVLVDGKPIIGNLIHPHSDGKTHQVKVIIG